MTKIHIPFAGLLGAMALLASCTFYPAPQGSLSLGLTIPRGQTSGSGRLILADALDLELRVERGSETAALLRVKSLQPEKKYTFTVQSLDLNFTYQVEAKVLGQEGTVLYSGSTSVTPRSAGESTPVNLILIPDAARREIFSWTTGGSVSLDQGKSAAYNLSVPSIDAPRGFRITGLPLEGVSFYVQDSSDGNKIDLGSSQTGSSSSINLPGGGRNYILTLFNSTQSTQEFPLYGGWVQEDDSVSDKRPLGIAFAESQSALDVLLAQGSVTEASPGVPEFRTLLTSVQGVLNDWTSSQSALDGKMAELTAALAGLKGPSVIKVTGLTLEAATLDLAEGAFRTLTVTVEPAGADNKNLTWSSADPTVASVDAAGKVTALKVGTTNVTATTADGGFTASITVKVFQSGFNLDGEDPASTLGLQLSVTDTRGGTSTVLEPSQEGYYIFTFYQYQSMYGSMFTVSAPTGGAAYTWMLAGIPLTETSSSLVLDSEDFLTVGNGTAFGDYTLSVIVRQSDGKVAIGTIKIRLVPGAGI